MQTWSVGGTEYDSQTCVALEPVFGGSGFNLDAGVFAYTTGDLDLGTDDLGTDDLGTGPTTPA